MAAILNIYICLLYEIYTILYYNWQQIIFENPHTCFAML